MSKESLATTLQQWEQLIAAGEADPAEWSHLQGYRRELQELLENARQLSVRQDALNAAKQQVTRDLDTVKERGRELASLLRMGAHSVYGRRSPKLREFGLRPRKGKNTGADGEQPAE